MGSRGTGARHGEMGLGEGEMKLKRVREMWDRRGADVAAWGDMC